MRFVALRASLYAFCLALVLSYAPAASFGQEQPDVADPAPSPPSALGNQGGGLGNEATETPGPDAAGEAQDSLIGVEKSSAEPEELSGRPAEGQALAAAASEQETDVLAATQKSIAIPSNEGSAGNLSYAVDIDVPAFRGLEPSLALNYDSSRKTKLSGPYQGWLGIGWSLGSFDVIERASPGNGLPVFDASDVYLLNGTELVPCASARLGSPSCASGVDGTHTTEVESYRRIIKSGGGVNQIWTVADRDGTVSTFKTIGAIAQLAADGTDSDLVISNKWLLTKVTDTHGNAVSYDYICSELIASRLTGACYPSTITYKSNAVSASAAVIAFYLEARPDFILMANGVDITVTKQRVKTVSVKVGSSLRSAYALSYEEAPLSRSSRLSAVDHYGTNATVASSGAITAPTAPRRIAELDYHDLTTSYIGRTGVAVGDEDAYSASDLNFDGRDELLGTKVVKTVKGGGGGDNGDSATTRREYNRSVVSFGTDGNQQNTSNFLYNTTISTNANGTRPRNCIGGASRPILTEMASIHCIS